MQTFRSLSMLAFAFALLACSAEDSEQSASKPEEGLSGELQRLRELRGSFEVRTVGAGGYELAAAESAYRALAAYRHDAVRELVDCLDDEAPSNVLLNGRAVPIGTLCGQALLYLAHFEATDSVGGLDADWPGYLLPEDNLEKRRSAKQVWMQIVDRRQYVLRSDM